MGQRGYGLSVFAGKEPERFDVEVVGVVRNQFGPGLSHILARLTGILISPRFQLALEFFVNGGQRIIIAPSRTAPAGGFKAARALGRVIL